MALLHILYISISKNRYLDFKVMLENNNKYEKLIVFELNSYIEMKLYIYTLLCKNVSFLKRKKRNRSKLYKY